MRADRQSRQESDGVPEPEPVRRSEKLSFYCTPDDSIRLEEALLALKREGVTANRGDLIRAAIDMALEGTSPMKGSRLYKRLSSSL